ncbi:unnamed protein product, partial [Bubo scandiacus]
MDESPDWATLSPQEFAQLQKYLDYSSRKVQDVLQEFDGDGGPCVDFEGFTLFLRRYLEADDVPEPLCRHLFASFQSCQEGQGGAGGGGARGGGHPRGSHRGFVPTGSDLVCVNDVSCYFSLLEGGRPEDKLEFTFKLYDKDGNGLLDSSEVDRIITQMMRVAQYLDWDVTELKPILQEMMREIDYDGSGTVSLAEWLRGGVTNIPLLVLLGLEAHMKDDGQHMWRLKHFSRPVYCNVCAALLVGLRKQGLRCTVCRFTVHERCARQAPPSCVSTYAKSRREAGVQAHVWVKGGCEAGKCGKCQKKIKSFQSLTGLHCVWCHLKIHEECQPLVPPTCGLRGPAGPRAAPRRHLPRAAGEAGQPAGRRRDAAGGGAAGFHHPRGPGAAGYTGEDLVKILREMEGGSLVQMDRWRVQVLPEDPGGRGGPGALRDHQQLFLHRGGCLHRPPLPRHAGEIPGEVQQQVGGGHGGRPRGVPPVCVCGPGPPPTPCVAPPRMKNKLWYLEFATSETIFATCKKLKECLSVECCGTPLDLSGALEGLAVLNIPSMHGGSNLWGEDQAGAGGDEEGARGWTPPGHHRRRDPQDLRAGPERPAAGGGGAGGGPGDGADLHGAEECGQAPGDLLRDHPADAEAAAHADRRGALDAAALHDQNHPQEPDADAHGRPHPLLQLLRPQEGAPRVL